MKPCFIKESKNGISMLFDGMLTIVILGWPLIITAYLIFCVLNPIKDPTTIEQAIRQSYWNMTTGLLYFLVGGFITLIYDIVIGIPIVMCYIYPSEEK